MNWLEYCPLALRTEAVPDIYFSSIKPETFMGLMPAPDPAHVRATRLMHAAAGLVTETQELADADSPKNVAEELGDCFWYLPIINEVLDSCSMGRIDLSLFNVHSMAGVSTSLQEMQHHAAELLNYTLKRHVIYGKELELGKVQLHFIGYVQALLDVCHAYGVKPEACMEANIIKLEKRYPKLRFDLEDASNRNVEHELSHIQAASMASVMPAPHDMRKLSESQKIAVVEAMMSDAGYYLSPYAQKELGIKRVMPILDMRKIVMDLIPDNIVLDAYALHVEENAAGDICIKLVPTPVDSVSYDELFKEPAMTADEMLAEMDEPVTYEGFCYLLRNEMTETTACSAISAMALELSNAYRRQGANALAEGFKAVYVNVMSNAKLELVIEDGFQLLCLLYPEPFPAGLLATKLNNLAKGTQDAAE